MKTSFLFSAIAVFLTACSNQVNQPQAPLDSKTVQEYNAKVYSGNTVPADKRVAYSKSTEIPLNKSDSNPKSRSSSVSYPNVNVGLGYGGYGGWNRYGYDPRFW